MKTNIPHREYLLSLLPLWKIKKPYERLLKNVLNLEGKHTRSNSLLFMKYKNGVLLTTSQQEFFSLQMISGEEHTV